MPIELKCVNDIIEKYQTFLFDKWGTIWDGYHLYPSVQELFKTLKKHGKKVALLSNATLTEEQSIVSLEKVGLFQNTHFDRAITSGHFLQHFMKNDLIFPRNSHHLVYIYGKGNPCLFQLWEKNLTSNISEADYVYIGGLETPLIPPKNNTETLDFLDTCIQQNKIMICANPDQFAIWGENKHYTQGTIALMYQEKGGKVIFIGKPYPEIFQFALETLDTTAQETVMFGDNLQTDIAGANRLSIASVFLYKTGVYATYSKEDLYALFKEQHVTPTYLLERF